MKVDVHETATHLVEHGYAVVPSVLTPEECAIFIADYDAARTRDKRRAKIQKRMFERSQANLELFERDPVTAICEAAIAQTEHGGPANANVAHVIHNNSFRIDAGKEGLAGSSWHADDTPHACRLGEPDITPLPIRKPPLVVTALYYLNDVPAARGPTEVVHGSHRFGCLPSDALIARAREAGLIRTLSAPIGSAILFDCQVWHRGAANVSDEPRVVTQVSYAKRIVGHKFAPFIGYQVPEHVVRWSLTSERRRRLAGFLPNGAWG